MKFSSLSSLFWSPSMTYFTDKSWLQQESKPSLTDLPLEKECVISTATQYLNFYRWKE